MKKPPTVPAVAAVTSRWLAAACVLAASGVGALLPAPVRAEPPPATAATPEPTPPEGKPLNFTLPLAINEPATGVRIPQYGDIGQLLSLLNSVSIKRLDENRLELQGTDLDLNKPDGKTDFHIRMPTAIFDTRTRMLTSQSPVVVSTTDFELQGERMQFDTGARRGRITGWVYMKVHNSKGVLGGGAEKTPKADETPAASP